MTPIEALKYIISETAAELDLRSMRICDVARAALVAASQAPKEVAANAP